MEPNLEHLGELLTMGGSDLLWHLGAGMLIVSICALVYWWMARALTALARRGRLSEATYAILRRLCGWAMCLVAVLLVL